MNEGRKLNEDGKLRIGFASGVRHAADYVRILSARPDVEIAGIAEEAEAPAWMRDAGRDLAQAAGIGFETGLAGLLDPERIDLAVICSEPTRHARLAVAALQFGLDTLVDKPVGVSAAEAGQVEDAARQAHRVCTVINRTFSPAVSRVRRALDAGTLGLPLHLDVEFLASGTHFATSVERPELVVDPALSGGGEMLNFLGYGVDYVHYLTGLAVEDVYAEAGSLFGGAHAQTGVEDAAVVSLGLERGVTATITVGRIPFAPGLGPTSSSLRVLGSHGYAVADDDRPQVLQFGGGAGVSAYPTATGGTGGGADAALEGFLDHVVGCLRAGLRPDYTVADARATMEVIDAAYAASARGRKVAVSRKGQV